MNTLLQKELLKSQILNEHNRLRSDPQAYIPFLENYLMYFKEDKNNPTNENILYRPNQNPIMTREGKKGIINAIEFLQKQKPIQTLTYEERLAFSAQQFANFLGEKGIVSNTNDKGEGPIDRIEQVCSWEIALAENIDYGNISSAQDCIINFLIDDGSNNKGHRLNLFQNELTLIGVGVAEHKEYNYVVVIDYIGKIRDKNTPLYNFENYKYTYPKGINAGLDDGLKKERKIKTVLQATDPDAPDNAISCKTVKKYYMVEKSNENDRTEVRKIFRKIYELKDGTQYILESENI